MNALVKSAVAAALPGGDWDPYAILGITRRANDKTIRSAYRKRAKELHSDVTGDASAFLLLKEAHDFLLDPAARALWDRSKIRATEQLRAIAVKLLGSLFDSVIDQIVESSLPPEHQHVPDLVRKVIRGNLEDLAKAQAAHRRKLARLKLMVGKVTRSRPGRNLAAEVLERRIGDTGQMIEKVADEIRLGEIMMAELENYDSEAVQEIVVSGASRQPDRHVFTRFF
jgi:hypothetical protein